tara:strand:- start:2308 stop:2814 length:507 start_codon:yes stop_codon:yes gene_type:complete
MPDYQKSKIYKITSEQLPGKCYIGSTVQPLKRRFSAHRGHYKAYLKGTRHKGSAYIIICYADAKITLIEDFPCECKKELEKREGVIMRCYMEDNELDDVVNKNIAGRTDKQRRIDNRDELNRKTLERYHKNIQVNRDKIKEYYRIYRLENRDEINRKKRELYHAKKII